jgi:hypothetical protein
VVYVGGDAPTVLDAIRDPLLAAGIRIYSPSAAGDPARDTASVGAFRCALLHLERLDGTADAIDAAELLQVYQPTLPVAFVHEQAPESMLQRARVLGPIFLEPGELAGALAWVREQALR